MDQTYNPLTYYDTTYCTHPLHTHTHTHTHTLTKQCGMKTHMQVELTHYTTIINSLTHSALQKATHTYKCTHSACNHIVHEYSAQKMGRFNTYNHASAVQLPPLSPETNYIRDGKEQLNCKNPAKLKSINELFKSMILITNLLETSDVSPKATAK